MVFIFLPLHLILQLTEKYFLINIDEAIDLLKGL